MRTVAIAGVGLIGASFGLALRQTGFSGLILGVSSPAAVEAGLACGAISAAATLEEAAERADLIYLAQPVDRILDTIVRLGPIARPETLITDAGSTKAAIVSQAELYLPHAHFIGGHPLAGKESRGAQSADGGLFRSRPYVLTPGERAVPGTFIELLRSLGTNILEMTPEEHDSVVALTSHLPQLISTALAAFLSEQDASGIQKVFGSGLIDMTRLAMSPADLWSSILGTNRTNVRHALQSYVDVVERTIDLLDQGRLDDVFLRANQFSRHIRELDH